MTAEAAPIDLAATPDFHLGGARVRPSSREIEGRGQALALEPRVMQVLVCLAARRGETVSRDDLILRCWEGVVVGEDAIQRCVGRLRKVAEITGGFEIETLSRIGYRLQVLEPGPAAGTAPQPERLLAVLPFDDLSEDADMAYLADGVAEDILQTIAKRSSIRAIGRTSSFQFRGADKVVARIGEALGVTHILDGSVRRAGERVRIAAHLMDISDQTMLWSDRFDGRVDDLFDLQDQVAQATVEALQGALHGDPAAAAPAPAATHDLILRLRDTLNSPAFADAGRSRELVSRLEAAAGDSAQAWGLIAVARAALRWTADDAHELELRRQARLAAERALALDPWCGAAHKALFLLEPPAGRFVAIERRLELARQAAPHDGEIHWSLYLHFLSVGRLKESFLQAEQAYRIDPLRSVNVCGYANALYTADRVAQSLALMRHALDRWPSDPAVLVIALWVATAAGDFDFVDRVLAEDRPDRFTPDARATIAPSLFAIHAMRHPDDAHCRVALDRLRADAAQGPPRFSLIGLCANLGADLDELFDVVEAADFSPLLAEDGRLAPMDGVPHLFFRMNARLRRTPRFADLCGRLGLIDYWRATGAWPDCVAEVAGVYDFRARCLAWRPEKD